MANAKTAYSKVAAPPRFEVESVLRWELFPFIIGVLALLTIVSVFHVWSRVKVIDLNLQLGELNKQMKEAQQEYNRLYLEAASLKTPARIEALAKGELGMQLPADQQVVTIR